MPNNVTNAIFPSTSAYAKTSEMKQNTAMWFLIVYSFIATLVLLLVVVVLVATTSSIV